MAALPQRVPDTTGIPDGPQAEPLPVEWLDFIAAAIRRWADQTSRRTGGASPCSGGRQALRQVSADPFANLRNVETVYLEQKRIRLPHRQKQSIATEARTNLMRWYEPVAVPGLLQTPPYAEAILRMVLDFYDDPAGDLEPALAARLERQQVLYRGNHRFYFIIAEQVLHTPVGTANVMREQLYRLLTAMSLPRVVLGILPTKADYQTPVMNNFVMFDSRMVQIETISAELTITQPSEIAVYEKAFHRLKDQAIHGQDARAMIAAAMDELRD